MNERITIVNDTVVDLPKVTRVEVIDGDGRSYVNWRKENTTQISLQDDGRTLKIFITSENKTHS